MRNVLANEYYSVYVKGPRAVVVRVKVSFTHKFAKFYLTTVLTSKSYLFCIPNYFI